ncbi:hypothetical protein SF123566_7011 [Shigella flexneri 1235-66]|nr:hypothetical protein SF123566_7011 [Shigella flexneri 1235-66]
MFSSLYFLHDFHLHCKMQFLSLHLRAIAKMLPPNNGNIFTKIIMSFLI